MSHAVEANQLVKEYGKKGVRALSGVDITIAQGEVFALLGPNGAGKTTFVKCVLGLLHPTSGTVTTFGSPPSDPSSRVAMGYVPEVPRFPGFLTASEVMDLHSRLIGLDRASANAQRDRLLQEHELADAKGRVSTFSKGMVRRLALAQALLGSPRLLVMDEPTADLDPIGRRDVRNRLVEEKEKGTTILLNSHLLSEVERICDRVAIIDRGTLLAQGSIDELVPEGTDLETVFVDLIEGRPR